MSTLDTTADIRARLEAAEAALHAIGQKLAPELADLDIAVLLPCYNEAVAIADVVTQFRIALPSARIYVYDNNSQDNTAQNARAAGAIVRREPLQGKGHVVRRMFSDIEADIYVMADGDATYDAAAAPRMISRMIETQSDMVVGARITKEKAAYRQGHRFGNAVLTGLVAKLFGDRFTDMLSGYRVFSRRFAKSYPALASGFETETELTVHALELDMITAEVQTTYAARPEGSASKLNTVRDGFRILATIGRLMRDERPLLFFGAISAFAAGAALVLGAPVILDYIRTGLVARFPTAFLCTSLCVMSAIALVSGVILETVALGRREMKRLAYNQVESLAAKLDRLAETRRELDGIRRYSPAATPAGARAEQAARDLTRPIKRKLAN
jgi:hypothetical protein